MSETPQGANPDHPNLPLLRKYWDVTTTADMEGFKALLAEDTLYHYPGQHYLSGDYQGRDKVVALYTLITGMGKEVFDGKVHAIGLTPDATYSLIVLSYHIKVLGNRSLPGRAVGQLRIEDGKVKEYWLFEWDQQMVNDIWWASAFKLLPKQGRYLRLVVSIPRIVLGVTRTMIRLYGGYKAPVGPY